MTRNTLHPETAAWGLLIGLWQRRFIDEWTVGEILDWHRRIASLDDANERSAPTTAKGGCRGHGAC